MVMQVKGSKNFDNRLIMKFFRLKNCLKPLVNLLDVIHVMLSLSITLALEDIQMQYDLVVAKIN